MCGRFVSSSPPDELARYFGATPPTEALDPNYNVAPTNDVFAVYEDGTARHLDGFWWGLVPSWAKDLKTGQKMINARAETIATKNAYRRPFVKRRCIIPADGFYEWKALEGQKKKQPYYIHRSDGEPLAFAGLWEVWRGPSSVAGVRVPVAAGSGASDEDPEVRVRSCTIITTSANETMAPIHDRMPVILPPSAWATWLDPNQNDVELLGKLLVPAPAALTMHPVNPEVNNVRNKGPHLIERAVLGPDGLADPTGGAQAALDVNG